MSIVPPTTVVTVTAIPPSEVWIDETRVGETPLENLKVPIGTRTFVFKNATLGERRLTTTVSVKPLQIAVDLTKPDFGM